MRLYAFLPNETGCRIYYVVSTSFDNAMEKVIFYDIDHPDAGIVTYRSDPKKYRIEIAEPGQVLTDVAD